MIDKQLLKIKDIKLPIVPQHMVADGCDTASARAYFPNLLPEVNFEAVVLPKLQRYSLNRKMPENNHMLGIAVAATELGLKVVIHKKYSLESDALPPDIPEFTRQVHQRVIGDLCDLINHGKADFLQGDLDLDSLETLLIDSLEAKRYVQVLLNWGEWDPNTQKRWRSPRHDVVIYGISQGKFLIMDPGLSNGECLILSSPEHLYESINEKQQVLTIGKK